MKKIVSILGGTDGFGGWLADYICQHFGSKIILRIAGRDSKKGDKFALKLADKYKLEVHFENNNLTCVEDADIVIYSLPISRTKEIILETLPYIRTGAIVSDVTSIKGFPTEAMQQRDDIIVIPTHPMFGPYVSSIAGQVVVLTTDLSTKSCDAYVFLKSFLSEKKARVIEASPKDHDRMMAVIQGLTHMNMYVLGDTMKRLGFDIRKSMDFVSPIYKIMISSAGRFLVHNPKLYADIQMYNEEVLDVHKTYLDAATNFHNNVEKKDKEKFCSDIEDSMNAVGKDNAQAGHMYTDKLIYMVSQQIEYAKNHLGKEIYLRDIYSGDILSGTLQSYDNGYLKMKDEEVYHIDNYEVLYN